MLAACSNSNGRQQEEGLPVTLTGRIEAEDEVALAFRISGRLLKNDGKLGHRVQAGQVVAVPKSQIERNSLRAAHAALAAAQGTMDQGTQDGETLSSDRTAQGN
jgi:multidrug efflux pump subunit AcrA (membrane-fusion protein)